MGWEVGVKGDIGSAEMRKTIQDFIDLDSDDSACIFAFIGHGFEVNGNHYLVPKDASLLKEHRNPAEFEADVKDSCRSLDFVQKIFETKRKGAHATAFILDCCRSCNFTTPSLTSESGLSQSSSISQSPSPKTVLKNSCIVYSANEGQTASDGKPGRGGPFMNTFVEEIDNGGDLGEVLERTRSRLEETSGPGKCQLCPFVSILKGKFHLRPRDADTEGTPSDEECIMGAAGGEAAS
eukprot:3709443-Rhodomonas_salina.1